MKLIKYLNDAFLTKEALLVSSKVTEEDFLSYQENGLIPKCSYKLSLNLTSDSFFGVYRDEQDIEYYAKGYVSWLGIIESLRSKEAVYGLFAQRYEAEIERLRQEGHSSSDPKLGSGLNQHIKAEWDHFLAGIYGLCTQSGLPEDIAAKEFAILEINELISHEALTPEQTHRLTRAVDLLDAASSMFAPHERAQSSRQRLVNDVRLKYKLAVE